MDKKMGTRTSGLGLRLQVLRARVRVVEGDGVYVGPSLTSSSYRP